jgi:hypothetical protein
VLLLSSAIPWSGISFSLFLSLSLSLAHALALWLSLSLSLSLLAWCHGAYWFLNFFFSPLSFFFKYAFVLLTPVLSSLLFGVDVSTTVVVVNAQMVSCPGGSKTVTLGGFFPFSGGWPVGAGVQPAFAMGIDDLNTRSDLLPSYCVRTLWDDTMCDPGNGLFFSLFVCVWLLCMRCLLSRSDAVDLVGQECSFLIWFFVPLPGFVSLRCTQAWLSSSNSVKAK